VTLRQALFLTVYSVSICAQPVLGPPAGPISAAKLSGCLARELWAREELKRAGLSVGTTAQIAVRHEDIPDTIPTVSSKPLLFVAFSKDGQRGVMFLFVQDNRARWYLDRNAYRLEKQGKRWLASEGNGGLGTYAAVARYVASIPHEDMIHLRIESASVCPLEVEVRQ
jgi:hypothetical protein